MNIWYLHSGRLKLVSLAGNIWEPESQILRPSQKQLVKWLFMDFWLRIEHLTLVKLEQWFDNLDF